MKVNEMQTCSSGFVISLAVNFTKLHISLNYSQCQEKKYNYKTDTSYEMFISLLKYSPQHI